MAKFLRIGQHVINMALVESIWIESEDDITLFAVTGDFHNDPVEIAKFKGNEALQLYEWIIRNSDVVVLQDKDEH